MARKTVHEQIGHVMMFCMLMRQAAYPFEDIEEAFHWLNIDLATLFALQNTRYFNPRPPVPKAGNLQLAWKYAEDPLTHGHFVNMLRVSPKVFQVLLELIQDHEAFRNNSNYSQTPVEIQLAATLYRIGHYGNGASVKDLARIVGCSDGSIENFTERCFDAIESLHDIFVRRLTPEEKEVEKKWIDSQVGFKGLWREGWVMYDGTIVVLYSKPGLNGDAYYTRKGNYGLNCQVCLSACLFLAGQRLLKRSTDW
jgi:hypothetical protein